MFSWRKKKPVPGPEMAKTPEQIEALLTREGETFSRSMKELEQELAYIERMPSAGRRYGALESFNCKLTIIKESAARKISEQIAVPKRRLTMKDIKETPFLIVTILIPALFAEADYEAREGRWENLRMVERALEKKGYTEPLLRMSGRVPALMNDILRDQTDALALSPEFDHLFDTRPEVRDAFTKAAVKARAKENHSLTLQKNGPRKPRGLSSIP
ncbi:MAG: hypothetical protein ACAH83_07010 [Alphaproteobacteria bacterium]